MRGFAAREEVGSLLEQDQRALARWPGRFELALLAIAIVIAGLWAFWPLSTISPVEKGPSQLATSPSPPPQAELLPLGAFSAPLWVVPAPPPPAPAPPPPPPALTLQLLGITQVEGGAFEALAYDPALDKVLTLKAGDRLGSRTVESVTATTVRFNLEGTLQSLTLSPAGGANAGGRP